MERIGGQWVITESSEDMGLVADAAVDVIVTSPPYNRGKRYSSDAGDAHDDALPEADYHALLRRVFAECHRCLRPDGVFFLNIGDGARDNGKSEQVRALAVEAGFHSLQTIAWVKSLLGRGHYTPSGGSRRLNNLWENIFVLVKDRRAYRFDTKAIGVPYVDKSNIGRYSDEDLRDPGNAWLIPYARTTGQTVKKGHDAPFPHELVRRCIALVPGARIVLDPFLGSGVTLATCASLGLTGIGFERFPRKALISETILGELPAHREPPLLPHLELAVRWLADSLCEALEDDDALPETLARFTRSARGRGRLEVLSQVLSELDAAPALRERLARAFLELPATTS